MSQEGDVFYDGLRLRQGDQPDVLSVVQTLATKGDGSRQLHPSGSWIILESSEMYQTGTPDGIPSPTDLQAEKTPDHSRILLDGIPLDHGSTPSSGMLSSNSRQEYSSNPLP